MQVPENLYWIHKIDNFIMCMDKLSDNGQYYQFTVTIIEQDYTKSRYQICYLVKEYVESEPEDMVVGALCYLIMEEVKQINKGA